MTNSVSDPRLTTFGRRRIGKLAAQRAARIDARAGWRDWLQYQCSELLLFAQIGLAVAVLAGIALWAFTQTPSFVWDTLRAGIVYLVLGAARTAVHPEVLP